MYGKNLSCPSILIRKNTIICPLLIFSLQFSLQVAESKKSVVIIKSGQRIIFLYKSVAFHSLIINFSLLITRFIITRFWI